MEGEEPPLRGGDAINRGDQGRKNKKSIGITGIIIRITDTGKQTSQHRVVKRMRMRMRG